MSGFQSLEEFNARQRNLYESWLAEERKRDNPPPDIAALVRAFCKEQAERGEAPTPLCMATA